MMTAIGSAPSVGSIHKHIPELDGVRGVAILLVTIYRFAVELPHSTSLGLLFQPVLKFGERGVDLFFVLSGFLITGILSDTRSSSHYFSNFYIRRALRILPLYYLALILFLFILPRLVTDATAFEPAIRNQFFLWTYLNNVHMAITNSWGFGRMNHFWSLAVEEHFYLVWPFVIYCCTTKTAFRTCLCLAVASGLSRILVRQYYDVSVAADVLTIFRLEGLCLGAALALWLRFPDRQESSRRNVFSVALTMITISILISIVGRSIPSLGHSTWAVIFVGLMILVVSSRKTDFLSRFFSAPVLRHFGKYSYAMYVFQNPLIPLISSIISVEIFMSWTGERFLSGLLYVAAMFFATWVTAICSWFLVERHFIRFKHRFQDHRPSSTSSDSQ